MRAWAVLVLVASILSGCTDPSGSDAEAAPDEGAARQTGRGDAGSGDVELPARGGVPAPAWQPGQWWRWSVEPRDHEAYEARTAVARVEDSAYVIGWADTEMGLRSQFFHFIPHASVSREDISWWAHGEAIDWLDFPLSDGKKWSGGLWLTELHFTAYEDEVSVPGGAGPGFYVGGSGDEGGVRVEIHWSVELGIFTSMVFYLYDETPWLVVRLLETGLGATPIHVLHFDQVLATFTSVEASVAAGQPPPAAQRIAVPEGTTHASIGCYLGGAPGSYAFRFTDSVGGSHSCETHNTDDWFGLQIRYGEVGPGPGVADFVTGGQGSVFAELFLIREEIVT